MDNAFRFDDGESSITWSENENKSQKKKNITIRQEAKRLKLLKKMNKERPFSLDMPSGQEQAKIEKMTKAYQEEQIKKLQQNMADQDKSIKKSDQEKSSQWLSEQNLFDRTFEELVKQNEKMHQSRPLNPDQYLLKHNKIFGIVPNQRLIDKIDYQSIISRSYLTKSQKQRLKKLEKFLSTDKMTHQELFEYQELLRRRSNLEVDQNEFKYQTQLADFIQTPQKLSSNRDLYHHQYFDELFYSRYRFNVRTNLNKKKKQQKLEMLRQSMSKNQDKRQNTEEELDYLAQKEEELRSKWLLHESHWLVKLKKLIIFICIFCTCMLIPVELVEETLQEIHHNFEEENENLVINHFELKRTINFNMFLYFAEVEFSFNFMEFFLWIVEFIFLLDIILNCFIIKKNDLKQSSKPINSIKQTWLNYYQSEFWFDFIMWIPWGEIGQKIQKDLHFLHIIKIGRLIILDKYLNNKRLKEICSLLFDKHFNKTLADPILSRDYKEDRTMIQRRILVSNIVIAHKILFYTILALYFTGSLWLVSSLIFYQWAHFGQDDEHYVDSQFSLSYPDKLLQSFYFALTTLSTVGFGDFYPKSDWERVIGAQIILFGVALFSIIISEFLDMVSKVQDLMSESTEDELLEIFFVLLKSFNDKKPLKQPIVDEITEFLQFKWANDKNNFLQNQQDHNILQYLTNKQENTVVDLYTKFIYMTFLHRFNRFFMISKNLVTNIKGKSIYEIYGMNRFRDLFRSNNIIKEKEKLLGLYYPFYSYNDTVYMLFMTQIFRNLEIRQFEEGQYLARELESCSEILMVDKGHYQVGFQVNNIEYFKLLFGKSTCIGAYNILFKVRHEFIYKTNCYMFCYAIRLENIYNIFEEIPQYHTSLKRKVISSYARNIFFPLMKMKREIINTFNVRKDYEQVICGKDLSNQGIIDSLAQLIFQDVYKQDEQRFEQTCMNSINQLQKKLHVLLSVAFMVRLRVEWQLQNLQVFYLNSIKNQFRIKQNKNRKNKKKNKPQPAIDLGSIPPGSLKPLKDLDIKLKNKIFTYKVWRSITITKQLQTKNFFQDQSEVNKLYISYMGNNPFGIIKNSLFRDGNRNYIDIFTAAEQKQDLDHQINRLNLDKEFDESYASQSFMSQALNVNENDEFKVRQKVQASRVNNSMSIQKSPLRSPEIQVVDVENSMGNDSLIEKSQFMEKEQSEPSIIVPRQNKSKMNMSKAISSNITSKQDLSYENNVKVVEQIKQVTSEQESHTEQIQAERKSTQNKNKSSKHQSIKIENDEESQQNLINQSEQQLSVQMNNYSTQKRVTEANLEMQIKVNDIEIDLNKSKETGPLSNGIAISSQQAQNQLQIEVNRQSMIISQHEDETSFQVEDEVALKNQKQSELVNQQQLQQINNNNQEEDQQQSSRMSSQCDMDIDSPRNIQSNRQLPVIVKNSKLNVEMDHSKVMPNAFKNSTQMKDNHLVELDSKTNKETQEQPLSDNLKLNEIKNEVNDDYQSPKITSQNEMEVDSLRNIVQNRQIPTFTQNSKVQKETSDQEKSFESSNNLISNQIGENINQNIQQSSQIESIRLPDDPNFSQQIMSSQTNGDIVTISSAQISEVKEPELQQLKLQFQENQKIQQNIKSRFQKEIWQKMRKFNNKKNDESINTPSYLKEKFHSEKANSILDSQNYKNFARNKKSTATYFKKRTMNDS